MTESTERVPLVCPACDADAETVHEVLKPGGQATVRCTDCGHVHKTAVERPENREIDVVVSQEGESLATRADVPIDERLAVGEEFVAETAEAIFQVRITSLERADGGREEALVASDVATIWTRAVGNVAVPVTIHPADGRHDETYSEQLRVPGDERFAVGAELDLGSAGADVEGILLRDDAVGYPADKLDRDGDAAAAKDIKRLYARELSARRPWSPWG